MKPSKRYSANDIRLERSALHEAGATAVGGKAGAQRARVEEIKRQFDAGSYPVDTDILAAKLLKTDFFCVD